MPAKTNTKQEAHPKAKASARKRGTPSKVAARTTKPATSRRQAAEPPKVDPAELRARLEQLRAARDELAEDVRDQTAPVDVDLIRAVQATDPALSLLPDEVPALARAEQGEASEKGYDPDVPLEQRTQKEKDATMLAHNSSDAHGRDGKVEPPPSRSRGKGKAKSGPSLMERITKVLEDADGPMSVKDIVAALPSNAFSSVPTPPSTRTYVQLHAGLARGTTVRVDKGVFDLKSLNPRGAKQRPKK